MAISNFDFQERYERDMREMQYRMKQDMMREMDRYAQQVSVISSPYQNALGTVTSVSTVTNTTGLSQMQMAAAQVESKTPIDPLGFMKLADSNKLLLTGVKP